jgi:hypothetical protein
MGALHLALDLPGMIYAGAPPLPTFLEVIALSVVMTWLYVHSGGTILLTSLFHATQSFFVIVNEGIPLEQQVWLMASVYVVAALIIAIVAGPRFARKPIAPVATRPGGEIGPIHSYGIPTRKVAMRRSALAWERAVVIPSMLASRNRAMTAARSSASASASVPFRARLASSPNTTSRTQWLLVSMCQCSCHSRHSCSGPAACGVRLVIA